MARPPALLERLLSLPTVEEGEVTDVIVTTTQGLGKRPIQSFKFTIPAPAPLPDLVREEEQDKEIRLMAEQLDAVVERLSELSDIVVQVSPLLEELTTTNVEFQPDESVFLGLDAMAGGAKDRENVAIGLCAGVALEGTGNVLIGAWNGHLPEGEFTDVTAIGHRALESHTQDIQNATALGAYSRVTGSHQVALGDSRTNVHTHSATHVRGDTRDFTEVKPSEIGLDFVLNVAPIEYRQDFRDAYIDWSSKPVEPEHPGPEPERPEIDDNDPHCQAMLVAWRSAHTVWKREMARYAEALVQYHSALSIWIEANRLSRVERDGSKSGLRTHLGFDASVLEAYCERIERDLALVQDHSRADGEAVRTYAPAELFPILWKAVQDLHAHVHSDTFTDLIASKLARDHGET